MGSDSIASENLVRRKSDVKYSIDKARIEGLSDYSLRDKGSQPIWFCFVFLLEWKGVDPVWEEYVDKYSYAGEQARYWEADHKWTKGRSISLLLKVSFAKLTEQEDSKCKCKSYAKYNIGK